MIRVTDIVLLECVNMIHLWITMIFWNLDFVMRDSPTVSWPEKMRSPKQCPFTWWVQCLKQIKKFINTDQSRLHKNEVLWLVNGICNFLLGHDIHRFHNHHPRNVSYLIRQFCGSDHFIQCEATALLRWSSLSSGRCNEISHHYCTMRKNSTFAAVWKFPEWSIKTGIPACVIQWIFCKLHCKLLR